MAANENMDASDDVRSDFECIVNRWVVDYYMSAAFNTFRNEQYADFCEIRDILQGEYPQKVSCCCCWLVG